MSDMLQLIRKGVRLRPIAPTEHAQPVVTPSDRHTQELQEVLERISRRIQLYSDDESDGSFDDD